MKKKYYTDYLQLARDWVGRSCADDAHTAKSRMFVDGDTLYSYGRHFVIARRVYPTDSPDRRLFLLTNESNSRTTNKQVNVVRHCIPASERIVLNEIPMRPLSLSDLRQQVYDEAVNAVKELHAVYLRKRICYATPDVMIEVATHGNLPKLGIVLPPIVETMRSQMWEHYRPLQAKNRLVA